MRVLHPPLMLLLLPVAVQATDLSKVDRTIRKEPAYKAKPQYCLLVVGPKAQDRVWLVQDGPTLFVDRNGNGDLTEKGERFEAKSGSSNFTEYPPVELDLKGGKYRLEFVDCTLSSEAGAQHLPRITLTCSDKKAYGAWGDETGPLTLAGSAKEAPVLHFGGPLQMGFEVQHPLVKKGADAYELSVGVGTQGLGTGSFVHLKYWNDAVPEKSQPSAVLEFPSGPGKPPVRVETVLKERC